MGSQLYFVWLYGAHFSRIHVQKICQWPTLRWLPLDSRPAIIFPRRHSIGRPRLDFAKVPKEVPYVAFGNISCSYHVCDANPRYSCFEYTNGLFAPPIGNSKRHLEAATIPFLISHVFGSRKFGVFIPSSSSALPLFGQHGPLYAIQYAAMSSRNCFHGRTGAMVSQYCDCGRDSIL